MSACLLNIAISNFVRTNVQALSGAEAGLLSSGRQRQRHVEPVMLNTSSRSIDRRPKQLTVLDVATTEAVQHAT